MNEQKIDLADEIEQNTSKIDSQKRDIERLEVQLSNMGGDFAVKRTSNKEKLSIVENELDGVKDKQSVIY